LPYCRALVIIETLASSVLTNFLLKKENGKVEWFIKK